MTKKNPVSLHQSGLPAKSAARYAAAGLLLSLSLHATDAFAVTALKQVQVSNGSQVDLLFDGKVTKNQIKTEFFNDIIQISLDDVSVYPAKISSVNGGNLTKIFAYQYAPKLVRCRLSVKGKAEDYKGKFSVQSSGPNGRMLTIHLTETQAPAAPAETKVKAKGVDSDEQALLDHVMKASGPQTGAVAQEKAADKTAEKISDRIVEKAAAPIAPASDESESKPINFNHENSRSDRLGGTSTKMPSLMGVFGKLALVAGLFSLLALAFKKFWKDKADKDNAIFGAIGKFARNSLGVKATGPKLGIEIVANHHLGPKRSIAVVKVGGRTMVVGITDQSINLIANLASEDEAMNALVELDNPPLDDHGPMLNTKPSAGATAAGPAVFANVLQGESRKPSFSAPKVDARREVQAPPRNEVRQEVKKDVRVTGYGSAMGGVSGVTGNVRPTTAEANYSTQAAIGLSGVRAQIKSKLEGLKQI